MDWKVSILMFCQLLSANQFYWQLIDWKVSNNDILQLFANPKFSVLTEVAICFNYTTLKPIGCEEKKLFLGCTCPKYQDIWYPNNEGSSSKFLLNRVNPGKSCQKSHWNWDISPISLQFIRCLFWCCFGNVFGTFWDFFRLFHSYWSQIIVFLMKLYTSSQVASLVKNEMSFKFFVLMSLLKDLSPNCSREK